MWVHDEDSNKAPLSLSAAKPRVRRAGLRAVVRQDPHRCGLQGAGGEVFRNRNADRMHRTVGLGARHGSLVTDRHRGMRVRSHDAG